jgi:hypothetical protein
VKYYYISYNYSPTTTTQVWFWWYVFSCGCRLVRVFLRIVHEFASTNSKKYRKPVLKNWFAVLSLGSELCYYDPSLCIKVFCIIVLNLLYYMLMLPSTINVLRIRNCKDLIPFHKSFISDHI